MKWTPVEQVPPPLHIWVYLTRDINDPAATSKQMLGGTLKTPEEVYNDCKDVGYTHWKLA